MDVDDPTWLKALTDLRHLQEVHIHNRGIYTEFIPVRMVYESATLQIPAASPSTHLGPPAIQICAVSLLISTALTFMNF